MQINNFIGIDYSMSCPAFCRHPYSKIWDPGSIEFVYLIGSKKYLTVLNHNSGAKFKGLPVSLEKNSVLRGLENAESFRKELDLKNALVGLEGYAFAGKGRIFEIGEHTAMLKYMLYQQPGTTVELLPPTVVKKFATDKGNANKALMVEAMIKHSGIDLFELFETEKIAAPVNDLADAYWMAYMMWSNHFINKKLV